jgi:hypothetical protein
MKLTRGANYADRLKRLVPDRKDAESERRVRDVLLLASRLQASVGMRKFEWSFLILRFVSVVRGFDRAHRVLVPSKPQSARLLSLLKPLIGEGGGAAVPGFGMLVAIAESQQPALSMQLDRMEAATNVLDQIYAFDDVLSEQLLSIETIKSLVDFATASEVKLMDLVSAAEAGTTL